MKPFMDQDFLLENDVAKKLYHEYAENMPIYDYHCHISPRMIYENHQFENIGELMLGGDHYKWRVMLSNGVDEKFIRGDASWHDKWLAFAASLKYCIGNPMFHWTHLELRRVFGIEEILSEKTAEDIWNRANALLATEEYRCRGLIEKFGVKVICTTDDPVDTLEYHQKLLADKSFKTNVLPAWRPDKAVNIEKPDFMAYIAKLEKAAEMEIHTFADLKAALEKRMAYFHENNCRLSDHGLNYVVYEPADDAAIEAIFAKKAAGETLTDTEVAQFKTAMLLFCAAQYKKLNWTMQLHYGCRRDNNRVMFEKLGPDTGYDTINNYTPVDQMAAFLGAVESASGLPRTILYSLNPADDQAIDTLCGCFQSSEAVSKMQHGSAWWFNDHFTGMTNQLTSLANLGYLAGFVGMLTDSRSFLSYPRHEYFRRILCRLLGEWVEDGRFPQDYDILGEIVRGISCDNARKYFAFPTK